jgi:hypothetical protein
MSDPATEGPEFLLRPMALEDSAGRAAIYACVEALANVGHTADIIGVRHRMLAVADADDPLLRAHVRVTIAVLCDFALQGWSFIPVVGAIRAVPPAARSDSAEKEKERVREGHRIERDVQLAQKATIAFLRQMERTGRGPGRRWSSVFSLMRDGENLAAELRRADALEGPDRFRALAEAVKPYVQIVRRGDRCEHTGLDLSHIWRYFRHTWTTTYQSTPGRHLAFLVRDAAAPNHPVIGIGALGSSIVQLRVRDEWIGWSPSQFLRRLESEPSDAWAGWIEASLAKLAGELFVEDFVQEGLLGNGCVLAKPAPAVIHALQEVGAEARRLHRLYPEREKHKRMTPGGSPDWRARALTRLFRSKRALALADLLQMRADLHASGFDTPTGESLERALRTALGRKAIKGVLRRMKARHVGVAMMDITVCGAVAPYNALLGGKLVALLMTSPDVVQAYRETYCNTQSVIASGMAGRPVVREPNLVLLGTTSLYGVASSQYNRIRMPVARVVPDVPGEVSYQRVGRTAGFGSYHFSQQTISEMDLLLAQTSKGREVNSIFGEGVNPKLRKVRAALTTVGLPGELLVQHGQSRIVYMVPLAENFREVLIGAEREPRYLLPQEEGMTERIAAFWRSRWLSDRVRRPGILQEVERHTRAYPVTHGARVSIPGDGPEDNDLFVAVRVPA